jgi:ABC superfamily ATP binding cassette transporter, membrane protein
VIIAILSRNNPALVPFSALFLAYIRVGADIMSRKSDVQNELVALIQALLILFVTAEAFLSGWEHRREVKESLAPATKAESAEAIGPATEKNESGAGTNMLSEPGKEEA